MTITYLNPGQDSGPPGDPSGRPSSASVASEREKRDYYFDYKRVALAYSAEIVIALGSLAGAALFANKYGHGEISLILMMLIAPIAYAVVEICRVPLALAVRTQPSKFIRVLAAVGLIAAAGVTVKSVSQLGQMMFQPRLIDVVHAKAHLDETKNFRVSLESKILAADTIVQQRREELKTLDDRLNTAGSQLGGLPKPQCVPISGYRDGRYWRSTKCTSDARTGTLQTNLTEAQTARKKTQEGLNAAIAERAVFDRTVVDNDETAAQTQYREAVLNSQLHSFTAMVFGKSPQDVTDGELYWFLNIFVFLPAICVAFVASLIALTAVVRIQPETVALPDEAASLFVGPYSEMILQAATSAARETVEQSIDRGIARGKRRKFGEVISGLLGRRGRGLGGLGARPASGNGWLRAPQTSSTTSNPNRHYRRVGL